MFLDAFKEVTHPENELSVISMKLSPSRSFILYISTNEIFICKANDPELKIIASKTIDSNKLGCLTSCGWLTRNSFFCISNKGAIVTFSFTNEKQIDYLRQIVHPESDRFTCSDAYNSYIVAGDVSGNLYIISPQSGEAFAHNIGNVAIKSIALSKRNGLILGGDGSTYSIDINPEILQKYNFNINLTNMHFNAYNIVASPFSNIAAAYTKDGNVFVTNFNLKRVITTEHRISRLAFGFDSTLFCISSGYIGILTSMQPEFRFYKFKQFNDISNFVVSRTLFILCHNDKLYASEIFYVPQNSNYPIYYKRSSFTYFVNHNSEVYTNKIEKPDELRSIKLCTTNGYYVACVGCGQLYIFNTQKQSWVKTTQSSLKSAKHLIFHNNLLVCVHRDVFSHDCVCKIMEINGDKLKTIKTLQLKGNPNSVRSNGEFLIFSFNEKVVVYNGDNMTEFSYSSTVADTHGDHIFTLARGRRLQCDGVDVYENVTNFVIDHKSDIMIFNVGSDEIYSMDCKTKKVRLLQNVKGIITGLFTENKYCLIVDDTKMEHLNLNYFSHIFANKIADVEQLSITMSPIQSNPKFYDFLVSGVANALSDGKADKIMNFVRHKPSAFRLFPKSKYLASEILAHFLGLQVIADSRGILSFLNNDNIDKTVRADYSSFIRLIAREEGQIAAVCCALEVLMRVCRSESDISHALSCIELPCPRTITDPEIITYFNKRYDDVIDVCFYNLVCYKRPSLCFVLATQTNRSIVKSLAKFDEPDISILKCIEVLYHYVTVKPANLHLVKEMCEMFSIVKYTKWHVASLLITGNSGIAMKILSVNENKAMLDDIKASQWAYLLRQ